VYEKTTAKIMRSTAAGGALRAGLRRVRCARKWRPGPDFFREMANGTAAVTGLDSAGFVEIAARNADEVGVRWISRTATRRSPFADGSFDFLVCRRRSRIFRSVGALREMRRVLRPGRKGVVIDLRRDVSMREINQYVEDWAAWMSALFTS